MTTSIRKPTIKATVPALGELDARALSLTLRLGAWPTAELFYETDAGKPEVRQFSAGSEISVLRALQDAGKQVRTTPDIEFECFDGNRTTLFGKGFTQGPSLAVLPMIRRGVSLVGEDAVLDGLDFSLYRAMESEWLDVQKIERFRKDSVAEMIRAAFDHVMEQGDILANKADSRTYATDRVLFRLRHESNKQLLPRLHQLLANSTDTTVLPELGAIVQADGLVGYAYGVAQSLVSIIRSQGSFSGILGVLLSTFDLIYVPSFDTVGQIRLASSRAKSDFTQEVEVLDKTTLQIQEASMGGLMPPQMTMTLGPGKSSAWLGEPGPVLYAYHPKLATATAAVDKRQLPVYLLSASTINGKGEKKPQYIAAEPRSKEEGGITLDVYQASSDKLLEIAHKASSELVNKLLERITVERWTDIEFGGTVGTFTCPLDYGIKCGAHLTFWHAQDKIGTGFCSSVQHDIQVDSQRLTGRTTIQLTHFRYA